MYLSVHHWHPLLNGYSGYVPPSYRIVSGLVRALPDAEALNLLLRATGLRYVLLHGDQTRAGVRDAWLAAGLDPTRVFGEDVLMTTTEAHTDLFDRLRSSETETSTLVGTPLAAVPPEERRASLSIVGTPPRAVLTGLAFEVTVRVSNLGAATWPVLSVAPRRIVELVYRWQDPSGRILATGASPLPYDLGPSRSVVTTLTVVPPATSGAALLALGVAQDGEWFAGAPPPIGVGVGRPSR